MLIILGNPEVVLLHVVVVFVVAVAVVVGAAERGSGLF